MGKPKIRLNPQVNSIRDRVLLEKALAFVFSCSMLLPEAPYKGIGRRPYDYRIVLVLSIVRVLLKKRYSDYESEMRTDLRLMKVLKIKQLPCKSTINNYDLNVFSLRFLTTFNKHIIDAWVKKPIDFLLDASGIRLVGRSVWFCIRTRKRTTRKDCDKVHIAVSLCSLLIVNFCITNHKRNDSPFLRVLLKPFNAIGLVIADRGYSNKINALFVGKKAGAFFSPFKKNACPSGLNNWSFLYKLWNNFASICKDIYNQRSKVEAVFSALKNRYNDQLYAKKWFSRRREMAMRFIAYNIRIIVGIQIAREKAIPLWVRA